MFQVFALYHECIQTQAVGLDAQIGAHNFLLM